ncbi:hypothetical protein X747_15230 [Mesorhizobium sp. LNJC384A00]|nr:hypothetical protein X747_15230 [Mesorhizobium sp. LNJC384A00]
MRTVAEFTLDGVCLWRDGILVHERAVANLDLDADAVIVEWAFGARGLLVTLQHEIVLGRIALEMPPAGRG